MVVATNMTSLSTFVIATELDEKNVQKNAKAWNLCKRREKINKILTYEFPL